MHSFEFRKTHSVLLPEAPHCLLLAEVSDIHPNYYTSPLLIQQMNILHALFNTETATGSYSLVPDACTCKSVARNTHEIPIPQTKGYDSIHNFYHLLP
jgi:hypothetical protein